LEESPNDSNNAKLYKKSQQLQLLNEVSSIIELLLRRGADPSLSCLPYPALCFAVAAGDIRIVKLLLEKGANVNRRMPKKYYSLTPLCLACGSLDESGPELVKLLLNSLANPNASSDIGSEYKSMCEEGWENETISDELTGLLSGRTPLHIAAARNDIYAVKVVKLLLDHQANPNVICNGQSPLSLAIATGNKETIDLLLKSNKCDPNLPLTYGVGSALCLISSTLYEHCWNASERIKLIEKLMHFGADILGKNKFLIIFY
jgi:ankyrin repeat and MYND domain-containing protein 1